MIYDGLMERLVFITLQMTTPHSCLHNLNELMENRHYDLKMRLKWSKHNQMMANPAKFLFMMLSRATVNHSIEMLIKKKASSKSVTLLGLTIHKVLSFYILISDL